MQNLSISNAGCDFGVILKLKLKVYSLHISLYRKLLITMLTLKVNTNTMLKSYIFVYDTVPTYNETKELGL